MSASTLSRPKPIYTSRWLSCETAAKRVGVKRRTIKRAASKGLPHRRSPAGRLLIDARALPGWWAEHKPEADPAAWKAKPPRRDDEGCGVIYALTDPRPERLGEIRYIGKTVDAARRRRDYRHDFNQDRGHNPALRKWHRKLKGLGLQPGFKVLEECLFGVGARERDWIAKGRAKGWDLLNCRDGGESGSLSEGTRRRLSEKTKGLFADPAYRQRWEEAHARKLGLTVEKWREQSARRKIERKEARERWVARMAASAAKPPRPARLPRSAFVPLTCGRAAFVPLTRGKWAKIDAEDWPRVSQHSWAAQWKRTQWRAKRSMGGGHSELLSRFIMRASPVDIVKPYNGKMLDARKINLEVIKACDSTTYGRWVGRRN